MPPLPPVCLPSGFSAPPESVFLQAEPEEISEWNKSSGRCFVSLAFLSRWITTAAIIRDNGCRDSGMDSLPLTTSGFSARILSVHPFFHWLPFFSHVQLMYTEQNKTYETRCSRLLRDCTSTPAHTAPANKFKPTEATKGSLKTFVFMQMCCSTAPRANHKASPTNTEQGRVQTFWLGWPKFPH